MQSCCVHAVAGVEPSLRAGGRSGVRFKHKDHARAVVEIIRRPLRRFDDGRDAMCAVVGT